MVTKEVESWRIDKRLLKLTGVSEPHMAGKIAASHGINRLLQIEYLKKMRI